MVTLKTKLVFGMLMASLSLVGLSSCSSDDSRPTDPVTNDDDNTGGDPVDDGPSIIGFLACEGGQAGVYPCSGMNLMSQIPIELFSATRGNDSWGWVDPATGREYALMGLNNGTAFVDITSPSNPLYLGKLPTASTSSNWRDIKVFNDHAFIVAEASGHGMQVFDLTKLRDVSSPPEIFSADALLTEFGSAHNIVINEDTGYAYAVGASDFEGGPLFINIQDPINPVVEGGYADGNYTHDAQVVTYNGPDTEHLGKEIFIGSNEDEIVIVDITDKTNPIALSTIGYTNVGYTHQGWFTEDQRHFLLGDELDEVQIGTRSRTIVFDFSDLDTPAVHTTYLGPTFAIDHNGYVLNNDFYLANYTAGIRQIDLSDIASASMTELAFFDTYPDNDDASFNGVWSVYPYLPSGNIIVSDISGGLFIVARQ
ncbi:choice-of-anchor B family protein [Gilvibacter sp.]|uniref:choice-of-anchor B family protein n=1 Tax=Gilvibacter sp. TaxID=2729997 RepID=UPI0025BB7607|nr:choice-of-anchor B family protein [Gilvibacter sp.]